MQCNHIVQAYHPDSRAESEAEHDEDSHDIENEDPTPPVLIYLAWLFLLFDLHNPQICTYEVRLSSLLFPAAKTSLYPKPV